MQKSLSLTNKVLNDGSQWLINRNSKALEAYTAERHHPNPFMSLPKL